MFSVIPDELIALLTESIELETIQANAVAITNFLLFFKRLPPCNNNFVGGGYECVHLFRHRKPPPSCGSFL